ncbi:CaiB/BaiF CoA transferase family protein [Nocardioides caldifontis]|uniref:CaiB/BaiF CoA transferase family protein n=1 Tax=Nocardioides caldifontis TaxID=2588938 RepID=UPI0013969176|nr:CoA transferase [Nocardioides caldifontis]
MKVVDLTRFVSGSYATMLLAALGADVVKVEASPDGDPYRSQGTAFVGGESGLFQALNTGKRSIVVDLRSEAGRAELDALLADADVFMENGRPGSLARLGLDAESVRERHPHLVYGSVSGYGQTGPESSKGGFDLILQAESGLMSVTGSAESGPVKVGAPVLDIGSAISCALGVVSALYARDRTGRGAHVTSSLIEFALACFTSAVPALFVDDELPQPMGSHSPTFAPYGAFRARDGSLVVAGAGSEALWIRFCEVLGATELTSDARFRTNAERVRNLDELITEIESRLSTEDVAVWLGWFAEAGVPAARVRNLREALTSPQVEHLGLVRDEGGGERGYRHIGPPLQVDGPLRYPRPAPALGEHDDEVRTTLRERLTGSGVTGDGGA